MNKKHTAALVLSWLFTAACLVVIFVFSDAPATVSSETSGGLIKAILEVFHIELSQFTIRKTAHALEYMGLCMAFNLSYALTFMKFCPWLSLSSAVLYASTDEIHQFFIEGRACQLRDVFVDTCGAVVGLVVCILIFVIYKNISDKREEKLCQC